MSSCSPVPPSTFAEGLVQAPAAAVYALAFSIAGFAAYRLLRIALEQGKR